MESRIETYLNAAITGEIGNLPQPISRVDYLLCELINNMHVSGAKTVYVNSVSGSDANDGLTTSTPFATLEKALEVTKNNWAIINLADGEYAFPDYTTQAYQIYDHNINIIGASKETVTISGTLQIRGGYFYMSNVTVNATGILTAGKIPLNFSGGVIGMVENTIINTDSNKGVYISRKSNLLLTNVEINGTLNTVIDCINGAEVTLSNISGTPTTRGVADIIGDSTVQISLTGTTSTNYTYSVSTGGLVFDNGALINKTS